MAGLSFFKQFIPGAREHTIVGSYSGYGSAPFGFVGGGSPTSKSKMQTDLDEINSVAPGNSGLSTALNALLGAYQTSAIKAETEAINKQYENNRNLIDYAFQKSQGSAREQMDFQANQANLAWERSLASANSQMAFQKDMLKQTMDYNERMSSTAYQRVMKDLRSAGLNPILAFSNGSASSPTASLPSGASASAQAMSGASASASALSSTKADYSSAKKADIADITGSLLSSAGKLISKLF